MLEMSRVSTPVDANISERAHHVVTGGHEKKKDQAMSLNSYLDR